MVLEGRFTTPGDGSAIIRSLQVHDPKPHEFFDHTTNGDDLPRFEVN